MPASSVELTIDAVVDETEAPKRLGLMFWLSVGWLALVVLLAVLADVLPFHDPTSPGVGPAREGPFGETVLGTDALGRDMLARTVHGARVSLIVGFSSIAAGLLIGGTIGLLAGYFRGRFETIAMGAVDVLLAFPALVLGLALVSFLGPSLATVTLAIAVLSIAPIARIIRANTLTFAQREFVLAARTLGAKNRRIIVSEILPNVLPAALSFALVAVAVAIVSEGALAFLGLSVPAPRPTWGSMINEGRTILEDAPHVSFVPSGVMFLTVLALNFAGDSLRARFDVREGRL
jgi:peptide/nickel transport system permease protein